MSAALACSVWFMGCSSSGRLGAGCADEEREVFEKPGCGGAVVPICRSRAAPVNGCLQRFCGCDGVTIDACGFTEKPFASIGPCPGDEGNASPGATPADPAPPVDASSCPPRTVRLSGTIGDRVVAGSYPSLPVTMTGVGPFALNTRFGSRGMVALNSGPGTSMPGSSLAAGGEIVLPSPGAHAKTVLCAGPESSIQHGVERMTFDLRNLTQIPACPIGALVPGTVTRDAVDPDGGVARPITSTVEGARFSLESESITDDASGVHIWLQGGGDIVLARTPTGLTDGYMIYRRHVYCVGSASYSFGALSLSKLSLAGDCSTGAPVSGSLKGCVGL